MMLFRSIQQLRLDSLLVHTAAQTCFSSDPYSSSDLMLLLEMCCLLLSDVDLQTGFYVKNACLVLSNWL